MQKRTLYFLLLISFLAVFSVSAVMANTVEVESKTNILRCDDGVLNISADVTADSISALEIVLEVSDAGAFFTTFNVVWSPLFTDLTDRYIDLSQADGVAPDTVRLLALQTAPGEAALANTGGPIEVARLNFHTNASCSGDVAIDGGVFNYPIPGVVTTQYIDAASFAILPVAVTGGSVQVVNTPPTISVPTTDTTIAWGSFLFMTIEGFDADTANGCEKLEFFKVSGPSHVTVDRNTGLLGYNIPFEDVCDQYIEVQVRDSCGATANETIHVCVTNSPPEFQCPTEITQILWGETASGTFMSTDVDPNPGGNVYNLLSFNNVTDPPGTPTPGPGIVNLDPVTGAWSWDTDQQPEYTGYFELCVEVTDSANTCDPCSPANADTCCITIRVIPFSIAIEKDHGETGKGVFQGQYMLLDVFTLDSNHVNEPIGGFDFLIQYDASVLLLNSVLPGDFIGECGWEYFQYRLGPYGNCGSGCPSGFVRIVALAEYNDGPSHPDCFTNYPDKSGLLAQIKFFVTNDRTYECQFIPVRFYWFDCGDNTLSNVAGDTLFVSKDVYDYVGAGGVDTWELVQVPPGYEFPGPYGIQTEPDSICLDVPGAKYQPVEYVDFFNGGIDIICSDSIDAPGDVNLNGIAYEIADAVMFTNYFVEGLTAFGPDPLSEQVKGSIAATDVNKDGVTLSVADLVYLIRVVVGDAQPYPKTVVTVDASHSYNRTTGMLTVRDVELGALALVVEGRANPTLVADGVEMAYRYDGSNTRILVHTPIEQLVSFSGDVLRVEGNIVSIEMATIDGSPVASQVIPTDFELSQNYPNPFNPSTKIQFALPTASQVDLVVFNVTGQKVADFSGSYDAGVHEVTFEANSFSSGVYFYRLRAGDFNETKKMVLLK